MTPSGPAAPPDGEPDAAGDPAAGGAAPGPPPSRLVALFASLDATLSVEDLAEVLGVTRQTLYRWLTEGVLPAYRVGGQWLVLRDEVVDWIAAGANAFPRPGGPAPP